MPFDPLMWAEKIEMASPPLARSLTMIALGLVSPFNFQLRGQLAQWSKTKSVMKIQCRRPLRNHVGSIHAGALFTLGETCAGLVIIKNFNFKNHRPLMSKVQVIYEKQARGDVYGVCEVSEKILEAAHKTLKSKKVPFISVKTLIFDNQDQLIARVKTTWQVKPWKQVRRKK